MQKFLSLLFSRRALAVVGVLVLALLVWFVGPLVSFDTWTLDFKACALTHEEA